MNKLTHISYLTIGFCLAANHPEYAVASPNNAKAAIGELRVFPFADKSQNISCLATHIGGGQMLTAGHCFLGAHHCNGAFVEIKQSRFRVTKHYCTEVLSIATTESHFNPSGLNYALFKVSPAPEGFFSLDPGTLEDSNNTESRSYLCGLLEPLRKDFFGRARKTKTFAGVCSRTGLPHGFPILDENANQIIGVVQGNFDVPTKELETQTYISPLPQDFPPLPATAVTGQFSTESFPNGLGGGFDFILKEFAGSGYVTVKISRSASTRMWIKEGTGIEYRFEGTPSLGESLPQTLQRPVQIRVLTGKTEPGLFSLVTERF